jgi:adenine-specific DNA-methyltransferase
VPRPEWESGGFQFRQLKLDAFEIDPALHLDLNETFARYCSRPELSLRILGGDFIEVATDWLCGDLFSRSHPTYTHAILNPPYKKIHSHSAHRLALRQVGIETVNLYSAFVALAVALLVPGGQLVAIIPRSFCNGPYLFMNSSAGLVFVTAFPNRTPMGRYLSEIAWETEVWVADAPSHMIP